MAVEIAMAKYSLRQIGIEQQHPNRYKVVNPNKPNDEPTGGQPKRAGHLGN